MAACGSISTAPAPGNWLGVEAGQHALLFLSADFLVGTVRLVVVFSRTDRTDRTDQTDQSNRSIKPISPIRRLGPIGPRKDEKIKRKRRREEDKCEEEWRHVLPLCGNSRRRYKDASWHGRACGSIHGLYFLREGHVAPWAAGVTFIGCSFARGAVRVSAAVPAR